MSAQAGGIGGSGPRPAQISRAERLPSSWGFTVVTAGVDAGRVVAVAGAVVALDCGVELAVACGVAVDTVDVAGEGLAVGEAVGEG